MSDAVALAEPCTTSPDTALALASERESYFVARTRRLLDESQAVEVNDLIEAEMATDLAAQVKTLMKKIEDERKRLTQPMNAQVKAVNTRFKTWTEPLKHAIYNFEKAEEQKAIAAAKARQAEADAAALEQAARLEKSGKAAAPRKSNPALPAARSVQAAPTSSASKVPNSSSPPEAATSPQTAQAAAPRWCKGAGRRAAASMWTARRSRRPGGSRPGTCSNWVRARPPGSTNFLRTPTPAARPRSRSGQTCAPARPITPPLSSHPPAASSA